MSEGHDIDLDWEREADRYYMYQVEREEEIRAEYEQWLDSQRKPAKITVLTPIKCKEIYESKHNTIPF